VIEYLDRTEIETVLAGIDRADSLGRRDYACSQRCSIQVRGFRRRLPPDHRESLEVAGESEVMCSRIALSRPIGGLAAARLHITDH
jgi:hypothetical protein